MVNIICYSSLFFAKVIDNALSTTKTIMIQRSRWILAGAFAVFSDFIYLWLVRSVVTEGGNLAILIVATASGVGCALACAVNERISKDRTFVNVIMSDDVDGMKKLREFLAESHITNVAAESFTRDWSEKTITITAYAETKAQSRMLNEYLQVSGLKCKRLIDNVKQKKEE